MNKNKILRDTRHEFRGQIALLVGRDLTDVEYSMIQIYLKRYVNESMTDKEEAQRKTIIGLEAKLKRLK